MEIQLYLKQIRKLDRDIDADESIIQKLKAEELKCTSQLSDIPRGTSNTDKKKISDAKMDLENTVRESKLKHLIMRNNALKMIDRLDDPGMRAIIKQYYINGLTWEQTAVVVKYSWKQMHRIHKRALNVLNKNMTLNDIE